MLCPLSSASHVIISPLVHSAIPISRQIFFFFELKILSLDKMQISPTEFTPSMRFRNCGLGPGLGTHSL